MLRAISVIALLVAASAAAAQPDYYRVVDVASDDTLNVRDVTHTRTTELETLCTVSKVKLLFIKQIAHVFQPTTTISDTHLSLAILLHLLLSNIKTRW